MTKYKKESLEGLLTLLQEITDNEENLWFKNVLEQKYGTEPSLNNFSIERIYEFCIKEVTEKQGMKFYEDFKLETIKRSLIEDYIRMEHFRREDNFEDFCLAMFQQLENIVIYLFDKFKIAEEIKNKSNQYLIYRYDQNQNKMIRSVNGNTVGKFIFQSKEPFNINSQIWYFNHKFRAVLYHFYFDSIIEYNTAKFDEIYNKGNDLYIMRNTNHRGAEMSDYQQKRYDLIIPRHTHYYFKFLGFLEDFTFAVNNKISTMH